MTYARARLWLGITGVGTVTLLAALLLLFRIPARTLPAEPAGPLGDLGALVAAVLGYAVLSAPFDWFGGWILPREYGRARERLDAREREGLPGFLLRWFRGALLHGVLLVAIGALLLAAGRLGGLPLALVAVLAVAVALIAFQARVAALVGGLRVRTPDGELRERLEPLLGRPLRLLAADAAYVTGGVTGLPGRERVLVPEHWLASLDEAELHAAALRRGALLASGARTRGLLLALAWTLAGFALGWWTVLGGAPLEGVAQLAAIALVSTLWSFLGVLLLPTPSRAAVHFADAAARQAGADPAALEDLLVQLERDGDDEPSRGRAVGAIFHPIPSVEARLARLRSGEGVRPFADRITTWHAARQALYLSWAGLGLLGRAVHCNSGRPDAWVLLPSD